MQLEYGEVFIKDSDKFTNAQMVLNFIPINLFLDASVYNFTLSCHVANFFAGLGCSAIQPHDRSNRAG